MSDNRVTITMSDGITREVHPDTPVRIEWGRQVMAVDVARYNTPVTTVYEPTREHWTPYAPWMRDVLAGDARVSWVEGGIESRGTWLPFASAPDIYPDEDHAEFEMRVHPADVPERPELKDDRDEALAKMLLAHIAGTRGMTWDNTGLRGEYRAAARAAREHIEQEIPEELDKIGITWQSRARRMGKRAEEAEAAVERLTRERDEAVRVAGAHAADARHWQQCYDAAEYQTEQAVKRHESLRADTRTAERPEPGDPMTDIKYEPTREHWTPYEPWLRDLLADDARVSWLDGDDERRATWDHYNYAMDAWLTSREARIHPDDCPEVHTEALAKALWEIDDPEPTYGWDRARASGVYHRMARAAREHIEEEKSRMGGSENAETH